MRVGIIQSNYIPWRGYFDFISQCDLFIFHDDLQYTKGDWRNRNKIFGPKGPTWLTVPVVYETSSQRIDATKISYAESWVGRHLNLVKEYYRKSPYFERYFEAFAARLQLKEALLSNLNQELIRWVLSELEISTPIRQSNEFHCGDLKKTERLIHILKACGATAYLSGPAAEDYLDLELFKLNSISLEYKSYDYQDYPQSSSPQFVNALSILDLLFNVGPSAKDFCRSRKNNEVIV